jgi:putative polyhydroxyalkanoate system protein
MAKISIRHEHSQPEREVREVLNRLTDELHKEYQITSVWHGNRIEFHRSGASGTLTLHPHQVDIEIKLNMMLSMFERKIREVITGFCQDNLK